jgi:hypothetical protein
MGSLPGFVGAQGLHVEHRMANADRIRMANQAAQIDAELAKLKTRRELASAADYRKRVEALAQARAQLEQAIELDWASEQNAGSMNSLQTPARHAAASHGQTA